MPMPTKGYTRRLTQKEVIQLFKEGRYIVDSDLGKVYSKKGKELYSYSGTKSPEALWVSLFKTPGMRTLLISHCIWLYNTHTPIPKGFQIHHRNLDPSDNRWCNLYCLHKLDHQKLHNGAGVDDIIEEAPF